MSRPSRAAYLLAAIGLHAAVLWGVSFGPPAFISDADAGPDVTEVALVETAAEEIATPEPPAPEPPPPELPTPIPPEPAPELPPPPPPPDSIPEPAPAPEKPRPPAPAPKRETKPAPKPAPAKQSAATPERGSPSGTAGAPPSKPGRGDNSHATWRNKVKPTYPEAARAARLTGSVQIQVNVNALGQPSGARVVRSSGSPALDEAALRAARASTFNPKRLAGIPLPDTIIVPITFRLEGR